MVVAVDFNFLRRTDSGAEVAIEQRNNYVHPFSVSFTDHRIMQNRLYAIQFNLTCIGKQHRLIYYINNNKRVKRFRKKKFK